MHHARTRLSSPRHLQHAARFGLPTVLLLWTGAALAQDATPLPAGPGHDEFIQGCGGCHDLDTVTSRRLAPADWKSMVDKMIGRGAALTDAQAAAVATYLARNFAATAPQTPIPIAPTGNEAAPAPG
jgi:mono/diheme cytochrome c family protein